jgi:hypothetical protein
MARWGRVARERIGGEERQDGGGGWESQGEAANVVFDGPLVGLGFLLLFFFSISFLNLKYIFK